MARVCSVLAVPRPERGYWAKLEFGKAPARPALPEALPGDPLFWSQNGDIPASRSRAVTATSAPAQPRTRRVVTGIHGLVQGAKQHYERGYKVNEGQLLPVRTNDSWSTCNRIVGAVGLDKALAGLQTTLFKALESAGSSRALCLCERISLIARTSMSMKRSRSLNGSKKSCTVAVCGQPSAPRLFYVGTDEHRIGRDRND